MKPMIVYINNKKENEVTLTTKELERIIDESYEAGVMDGLKRITYNSSPNIISPTPTWRDNIVYCTSTNEVK